VREYIRSREELFPLGDSLSTHSFADMNPGLDCCAMFNNYGHKNLVGLVVMDTGGARQSGGLPGRRQFRRENKQV
jgi:hypothetical protein